VLNILSNALKYSSSGDTIQINTELVEKDDCHYIEVSIKDDGPGISKE